MFGGGGKAVVEEETYQSVPYVGIGVVYGLKPLVYVGVES